jgi:phenylalanyl-tRNA synthetase alpha chain
MEKLLTQLENIASEAAEKVKEAKDDKGLESLRIKYLGRKSSLTEILRSIKDLKKEEKGPVGKKANETKIQIEKLLDDKQSTLRKSSIKNVVQKDWLDVTIPTKGSKLGHLHPITQMRARTVEIFQRMGFEVVLPNEIDDDYHNFTAVNIPEYHPARDAWDTFWTEDGNVLITHTSSMQHRVLSTKEPPIRVVVPGRCFRNEATDARHEHTFHQVEGVYVDRGITLGDMLGVLEAFFEEFFERDIDVKFTPDFFPFVEPGGMMSLTCVLCDGKGCRVCKKSGWLEILGCGMIHPNVLKEAGVDPNVYSGFAWGFGLERLIMLKYNVDDIRLFESGDLRFIKQF